MCLQGTGNGHIARALDIIPILKNYGKVDIAISGNQCDIELPWDIKYRLHGAGFIFGTNGGVDFFKSVANMRVMNFVADILTVPVWNYDLVINDFEPVVAWACRLRAKECIGLSHQSAVLHKGAPKPKVNSWLGRFVLRYYAPASCHYGFHFKTLGDGFFTPVIRKDIRSIQPEVNEHYSVYLPAYSDEAIVDFLTQYDEVSWQVFSKHNNRSFAYKNVFIQPVNNGEFVQSMASAKGVLCNAGFETPAEALFLKKKLCVLPMRGQYEQLCNAAMLKTMGVPVYTSLGQVDESSFRAWLKDDQVVEVNYPDNTDWIISSIVKPEWCIRTT
ncbi:glycosyltransferase family protein [Saccharicrinis fermentans]|uniref:glycosyltransferase family protein n=1 Tax=Saccharicrinis fermentans TaxID=982 RepID=UPI0009DF56B2|nr:glycosyltransferase family protein [Saccharicrinis fermentans]